MIMDDRLMDSSKPILFPQWVCLRQKFAQRTMVYLSGAQQILAPHSFRYFLWYYHSNRQTCPKRYLAVQSCILQLAIMFLVVCSHHSASAAAVKLAPKEKRTLTLLAGQAMPPYICSASNSGLELDIVRQALALEGYQLQTVHVPLARVPRQLMSNGVDGALTLTESLPLSGVYLSKSHIRYDNVLVSLAQFGLSLDRLSELAAKSLVAFQNADHYLGQEFQQAVANNPRYREHHDQAKQVAMLFKERTQLIVIDKNIFKYYWRLLKHDRSDERFQQGVRYHRLFPPSDYRVGFVKPQWRDAFNRGLAKLRASGSYKKLLDRYLDCPSSLKSSPDMPPRQSGCSC